MYSCCLDSEHQQSLF